MPFPSPRVRGVLGWALVLVGVSVLGSWKAGATIQPLARHQPAVAQPTPYQQSSAAAPAAAADARTQLDRYCVTCHNDRVKAGSLILDKLDTARLDRYAESWEKVL